MTKAMAIAVCAGVALVVVAPAPAASKSCAKPETETVRKNAVARLYTRGPRTSARLMGCLRSRGIQRAVLLAENYDDELYETGTWDRVRLWRRFAAWRYTRTDVSCKADCPPGYGRSVTYRVRDLASGKSGLRPEEFRLGRTFVVTTTRVIATVVAGDPGFELRTWDGREDALLDSGGIDPASLHAHGDRVVWTKAGERKRARLPPPGG